MRKGLVDPLRDGRIVSSQIRHIAGNSLLTDHNYCSYIGLREGYVVLAQLIAQLLRFTGERGPHRRVGSRTNQSNTARNRRGLTRGRHGLI